MITLDPIDGDAAAFVALVSQLANGIGRIHSPARIILVRIDNWFGPRWLGFAGKAVGAAGVHSDDLTVPPFHPNRVVQQWGYKRSEETQEYAAIDLPPLHLEQTSADNLGRRLRDHAPDTAVIWFSSNSEPNGRGAVMACVPGNARHTGWYCGLESIDQGFGPEHAVGISAAELDAIRSAT